MIKDEKNSGNESIEEGEDSKVRKDADKQSDLEQKEKVLKKNSNKFGTTCTFYMQIIS